MKKVLYIGWIGYKNLGDELMFDLFKEQFSTLGDDYTLDSANIEPKYLKNVALQEYDLIVLGGGSILGGKGHFIHPYIISYLYECISLNKKVMIWGSGIDWVPKPLIEHLENNILIPFSVSDDLKQKIAVVFEKSVWSGVRGPLTLKILEQYGVQNCHISGDPGFLLNLDQRANKHPMKMALDSAEPNKKVVGVNWGTSFNNIYGGDEQKVEEQLADALNQLIEKGYHIYLYTVWGTDLPAIERLHSKLVDSTKVTLDRTLYDHNELLALMQDFMFTINFKLHANYLSLAANVPFIALGYRSKMFDFVKSVNLEDFIISTDESNISEQILSMESEILSRQSEIKAKMDSSLNLYRDRLKEPFKHGLYI
ncbi:polysaccharide pyruvyl transferase family protein [Amphibacillus sp. Q70]|uniref:polysaccharide pyruvyl transferase family protein n=1 Tax=Amphibacillus sp. Q70 TaxID=3453416 RepID=UPI003F83C95D